MDPVKAIIRQEFTELIISIVLYFVQVLVSEHKPVFLPGTNIINIETLLILKKAKINPLLLNPREVILVFALFHEGRTCFNIVSPTVSSSCRSFVDLPLLCP